MSKQHEIFSKISFAIYAIALAFAVVNSASANADGRTFHVHPDRNIVKGQTALNEGDYEQALRYFQNAARRNLSEKHSISVQNSICASLYLLERYEEAADTCTGVIDADKSYWRAYVNRGNALRALGQTDDAISDFCKAHTLRPKNVKGNFETYCES